MIINDINYLPKEQMDRIAKEVVDKCTELDERNPNAESVSANPLLSDGWQSVDIMPEYDKFYLGCTFDGNYTIVWFWADTWENIVKGHKIIAYHALPALPSF